MRYLARAWIPLKIFANPSLYRICWAALILIPLVSNVAANLEVGDENIDKRVVFALLSALDPGSIEVPTNMSRVFWASLSGASAGLLFLFFAPVAVRFHSFESWIESFSGALALRIRKMMNPTTALGDLKEKLRDEFLNVSGGISLRVVPLIFAWGLCVNTIYLMAVVMIVQVHLIAESQNFSEIYALSFWG